MDNIELHQDRRHKPEASFFQKSQLSENEALILLLSILDQPCSKKAIMDVWAYLFENNQFLYSASLDASKLSPMLNELVGGFYVDRHYRIASNIRDCAMNFIARQIPASGQEGTESKTWKEIDLDPKRSLVMIKALGLIEKAARNPELYEKRRVHDEQLVFMSLWTGSDLLLQKNFAYSSHLRHAIDMVELLTSVAIQKYHYRPEGFIGAVLSEKDKIEKERWNAAYRSLTWQWVERFSVEIGAFFRQFFLFSAAHGYVCLDDWAVNEASRFLAENPAQEVTYPYLDHRLLKGYPGFNLNDLYFILFSTRRIPESFENSDDAVERIYFLLQKGDARGALNELNKFKQVVIKQRKIGKKLPLMGILGVIHLYLKDFQGVDSQKNIKTISRLRRPSDLTTTGFFDFATIILEDLHFFQSRSLWRMSYGHTNAHLATGLLLLATLKEMSDSGFRFEKNFESHISLSNIIRTTIGCLYMKGQHWISRELLQAYRNCGFLEKDAPVYKEKEIKAIDAVLVPNVAPKEEWELDLKMFKEIIAFGNVDKQITKAPVEEQLGWEISSNLKAISPIVQKRLKNGNWGKGRRYSIRRLVETEADFLNEWDHKIVKKVKTEDDWYGRAEYFFGPINDYLDELQQHPRVWLQDYPHQPITFSVMRPELTFRRDGGFLKLEVTEQLTSALGRVSCIFEDDKIRIEVLQASEKQESILNKISDLPLKVPEDKVEAILPAIRHVNRLIPVQNLGELEKKLLNHIEADSRAKVVIHFVEDRLDFGFFVRPFGRFGNNYFVADGEAAPICKVDGQDCVAERRFEAEKESFLRLWHQLLDHTEPPEAKVVEIGKNAVNFSWSGPVTEEETLLALSRLRDLEKDGLTEIHWTEESKKLFTYRPNDCLKINIKGDRKKNHWFSVTGELPIDEKLVLSLSELLHEVEDTASRFVKIGQREFLELTEELMAQLKLLKKVQKGSSDGKLPLAGLYSMQELLTSPQVEIECTKVWKDKLASFKPGSVKDVKLTKTFKAKLRPYQYDGLNWLNRMAEFGFGACLADDMGLGKTIQCLALLHSRKKTGACLVVAPSSLILNWELEAKKFAPTLKVSALIGGSRLDNFTEVKAGEVYLTSYGQLIRDIDKLQNIEWATVILDECQAIKNPVTQRAKACRTLKAQFKVGLSGTPVENHLTELWSLFHFLNPGLLGGLTHFKDKFIGKKADNKSLKKLVQPFLLRRTKAEVLKDLPEKVEKTLLIEPSKEEAAFYEALRRKHLKDIEATKNPNDRYMKTIVALTKLRRASCHTSLIDEESRIPSSKHTALMGLLEDVVRNGHRALIFSQFVDHLKIVAGLLDEASISFQYLDGSTPIRKRQKAVDAFQDGEGDVFLISLKAGGFGLNLTAADYVFHLDPWWNPAVEDQASDRSHRIGQKRAVNVYRLVSKGGIEEKIIELHATKRKMAESILSSGEGAAKLSADELFRLLNETKKF